MKITHNKVGQNLNSVDGAKAGKTEGAGGISQGKLGALGDADLGAAKGLDATKVAVSDRAQDSKKIKELAMAAPDVDAAKVAKFRALIDSGNYKVDAKSVADRMVDSALEEERMSAQN